MAIAELIALLYSRILPFCAEGLHRGKVAISICYMACGHGNITSHTN